MILFLPVKVHIRSRLNKQGDALVILLAGGDKSSQDQEIRLAKDLARTL